MSKYPQTVKTFQTFTFTYDHASETFVVTDTEQPGQQVRMWPQNIRDEAKYQDEETPEWCIELIAFAKELGAL